VALSFDDVYERRQIFGEEAKAGAKMRERALDCGAKVLKVI